MKAIAFTEHGLPINDPRALQDVNIAAPRPGPRDLLVGVEAVSVNPVDTYALAPSPRSRKYSVGMRPAQCLKSEWM